MSAAENPTLDEPAARRLTRNIRLRLDAITGAVEGVLPLIEQARDGGAHLALGFKSWTAYVEHEFGGQVTRLDQADRRPLVELLAGTGLPTRAIATVVGASQTTVVRDLEPRPVEPNDSPGADAEQIATWADSTDESRRLTLVSGGQTKARRTVAGRDGKTYTAPRPRPATPKRERAAAERRARSDLYSGIAIGIRIVACYGRYEDVPGLMAEFDPAELRQPQDEHEFDPDNLRAGVRFLTELIKWAEARR